MASDEVKPGEIGKFVVMLQAPQSGGTYSDSFRLAAEDYSWMKGGEMKIEIYISSSSNNSTQTETDDQDESSETDQNGTVYNDASYEAKFLISSHRELRLKPLESATFKVGFKKCSFT